MTRFRWMHFLKVPTRATSDSSELPASTKFVHNVVDAWGGSGGSGAAISFSVSQTTHGFSVLTPVFYDIANNVWAKAKADSADTLATHVVVAVADADNFTVGQAGKFTITGHGLAEGYWFTSADTAGTLAQTDGLFSNPALFVLDADTVFLPSYRPSSSEGLFGLASSLAVTGAITLPASSVGKWHICSGTTTDYTIILPSPAGCAGKYLGLMMDAALTMLVTLDAGAYTLGGQRYRYMHHGEVAVLRSDGSQWVKVAGVTIPMKARLRATAAQSIAAGTPTKLNATTCDFTTIAAMADTTNKRILIKRPGKYELNLSAQSLWAAAGLLSVVLALNGAWTSFCEFYSYSQGHGTPQFQTKKSLVAGDYVEVWSQHWLGQNSSTWPDQQGVFIEATEIPEW